MALDRPRLPRLDADDPPRRLELPQIAAISALGVFEMAVAYALARQEWSGALALYWLAQALVLGPVAWGLLRRGPLHELQAAALVLLLAVHQFLLKWMYSPTAFRFPDELQHWRGTTDVLESGEIFVPNVALPVATSYPGLELMGASVASLTGLPVFAAGVVVVAVVHLATVAVLFAGALRLTGSPRVAGVACLVYAANPHYLFFGASYLYQVPALLFLLVTLWSLGLASRGLTPRAGAAVVTLLAAFVVHVTHHVTSAILVAVLLVLALADTVVVRRHPARAAVTAFLTIAVIGGAVAWTLLVAEEVVPYLSAPLSGLLEDFGELGRGGESAAVGRENAPGGPLYERVVAALALLAFALLLLRGWYVLRPRLGQPWPAVVVAASAALFATVGLRFLAEDGAELYGRSSSFVYLPVAAVVAIALVEVVRRADRPPVRVAGVAVLFLLFAGGVVTGWPAYWGRLPGPHLVAGFERGVDAQGVDVAVWTREALGPGNRVAAELTGHTLMSTYGAQDPVWEVSELYYGPSATEEDRRLVQVADVDLVHVDLRMSERLPAGGGAYFAGDTRQGEFEEPLPREWLEKFDEVPGVDRLYDSGDIRLYDVRGSWYDR